MSKLKKPTINTTITKREFVKFLKEKKVFVKFCVCVAQAFDRPSTKNPKDLCTIYLANTAMPLIEGKDERFIEEIRRWWVIKDGLKIQP